MTKGESVTAERGFAMTPTARKAAALRRKRQIISQTVIDRALNDPRRRPQQVAVAVSAAK
ncbi:hypothetical protein [Spirillospora sp. CA-128828]|uniref:hypothetical protein n=1 Tax=Spirillospora sp. CA-128828 TaxID=3240033 RepID=UPI003D8E251C